MMNVTSLELSKELYEISGWDGVDYSYCRNVGQEWEPWSSTEQSDYSYPGFETGPPAYDLGYLLRKLPADLPYEIETTTHFAALTIETDVDHWYASYSILDHDLHTARAKTPEDAAAKLCITLFKQGILKK
jgi:hypothetical protein